jgi:DNA-binding GntR family transcriptional regulator
MILNREFEPGERITQVQLAALLGVSMRNHTMRNHEDLFQSNWAFHSALHNAAGAPALGLMLKNTLRFFPDFSVPVEGWRELAAQWRAGLIREFTDGSRAGAKEVARSSIGMASELFIASFWSDAGAGTAGTGH